MLEVTFGEHKPDVPMQNFSEYLDSLTTEFTPIVDNDIRKDQYVAIDLSENNPELLKLEVSSSEAFSVFVNEYLKNHRARAAYGGYNELRTLYKRSELFNNLDADRNIHIGLDIWVPADTSILSPLDGKIHSFKNNANFGDYGPTIILEHNIHQRTFYTLYGHLSKRSLENLAEGDPVKAGQKIASLGDFYENGDYAPHLHFQIIENMFGNYGDFPGVVKKADLDMYLQNCPDPNLLLKIDS